MSELLHTFGERGRVEGGGAEGRRGGQRGQRERGRRRAPARHRVWRTTAITAITALLVGGGRCVEWGRLGVARRLDLSRGVGGGGGGGPRFANASE